MDDDDADRVNVEIGAHGDHARPRDGDNLKLVFTRIRDGEMVRQAEGELIKVDSLNEAN